MKFLFSSLIVLPLFLFTHACKEQGNTNSVTEAAEMTPMTKHENLDVVGFREKMANLEDIVLMDVRTPEEIAEGKINGAMEMDIYNDDFESRVLELDRDKHYFVYCRSGARSADASRMMIENGFKYVYNLKGGFLAWSKSTE